MAPISLKKIGIIVLVIIALSRLDRILAVATGIYQFFCDSLAPFRDTPAEGRFVVALAILVLVYVTVLRLLHNRGRK